MGFTAVAHATLPLLLGAKVRAPIAAFSCLPAPSNVPICHTISHAACLVQSLERQKQAADAQQAQRDRQMQLQQVSHSFLHCV